MESANGVILLVAVILAMQAFWNLFISLAAGLVVLEWARSKVPRQLPATKTGTFQAKLDENGKPIIAPIEEEQEDFSKEAFDQWLINLASPTS